MRGASFTIGDTAPRYRNVLHGKIVNGVLTTEAKDIALATLRAMAAEQQMLQAYARFDYDLTDSVHFYVSGFYNRLEQYTILNNTRANGANAVSGLATR